MNRYQPKQSHMIRAFNTYSTRFYFLILLNIVFSGSFVSGVLYAQEIDFGEFSDTYAVTISQLTANDLDFGVLIKGEGPKSIDLADMNAKTVSIEGIKYLDVIVDITASSNLYLDDGISCNELSTDCIPFTMGAAYANQGSDNKNQAVLMQVSGNYAVAQFPLLNRGNLPPGPPPTPNYESFNPSDYNTQAYLYIYGSINVGENLMTGVYSGNIIISISYD